MPWVALMVGSKLEVHGEVVVSYHGGPDGWGEVGSIEIGFRKVGVVGGPLGVYPILVGGNFEVGEVHVGFYWYRKRSAVGLGPVGWVEGVVGEGEERCRVVPAR